jgi:hypothetical protein
MFALKEGTNRKGPLFLAEPLQHPAAQPGKAGRQSASFFASLAQALGQLAVEIGIVGQNIGVDLLQGQAGLIAQVLEPMAQHTGSDTRMALLHLKQRPTQASFELGILLAKFDRANALGKRG